MVVVVVIMYYYYFIIVVVKSWSQHATSLAFVRQTGVIRKLRVTS